MCNSLAANKNLRCFMCGLCQGFLRQMLESARAPVMFPGMVPSMDQISEFAATLATASAKAVTGWM